MYHRAPKLFIKLCSFDSLSNQLPFLLDRSTGGGSIAQWLAYLLPDPAAPGLIPSNPEIVSDENIVGVAQVNQRSCLDESGQWLENNAQTHVALSSGKLVLHNS